MGLDMYAYAGDLATGETTQIAYWRKHNALHSWIEKFFRKMSYEDFVLQTYWPENAEVITREAFKEMQTAEDFNCIKVPLNSAAIDKLEAAIEAGLPQSEGGFFFGDTHYDPKDQYGKKDQAFIKAAREAIKESYVVLYDCWW